MAVEVATVDDRVPQSAVESVSAGAAVGGGELPDGRLLPNGPASARDERPHPETPEHAPATAAGPVTLCWT